SLYRSIFHLLAPPRDLHSFPTRRSSDLCAHTLCGLFAAALTAMGAHRRRAGRAAARIAGLAWLALTAEFAWARIAPGPRTPGERSEEHTSELQSRENLVCRLLLEKKKDQ